MKIIMILLVLILLPGAPLAADDDCGRCTYWWTSLAAITTSASVLLTSAWLTSNTNDVYNHLKQLPSETPEQTITLERDTKEIARALNIEIVGTSMAALELVAAGLLFWTNYRKQQRMSAFLSVVSLAPALLNAITMGVGVGMVNKICNAQTNYWSPNDNWVYTQWMTAWGVMRALAFVPIIFSWFGTCAIVCYSRDDFFRL